MLRFLFPRLTAPTARGQAAFTAIIQSAREPGWYRHCLVADTLDGRFALLATLTALVLTRVERLGEEADSLSVALTERFIEAMEAEHREFGISDPALGRTVRKLVAMLEQRTDLWRGAVAPGGDWDAATRASLFRADPHAQIREAAEGLADFWQRLSTRDTSAIEAGELP